MWYSVLITSVDYKVNGKILAMILQSVLSNIINDDQSGNLKSCYIGQNIRILEYVSFLLNEPDTWYITFYWLWEGFWLS